MHYNSVHLSVKTPVNKTARGIEIVSLNSCQIYQNIRKIVSTSGSFMRKKDIKNKEG